MQKNSTQTTSSYPTETLQSHIETLQEKYPFCITRAEVEKITGGLFTVKYLANLDSKGEGPDGKFRLKRKVAYLTGPFCVWMVNRMKMEK